MTYQATRNQNSAYNGTRQSYNRSAASARPTPARRTPLTAEERAAREAAMRRAQAARARAEREEAVRIARLEHERVRREREIARIKEAEKRMRREQKREARLAARREEDALLRAEIKVERRRAPLSLILGIIIAFVLLLGVVYSFSMISESSAELSAMKAELEAINAEAAKYALEIEAKNDLGVIEDLAVNELNMVKEGSVQKKYITVMDGDRIVLKEDTTDDSPESYGGILSGLSAAFDGILDYIR